MKIIVSNVEFPYNEGVKLLKLKNKDCPFESLSDIWNDIVPINFKEILKLKNLEQRRVAINILGLNKLKEEIGGELVNSKTLKKTTSWVKADGTLETVNFNDTYELYKVDGKKLSSGIDNKWQRIPDSYFIKFKDTSTDREYLLWIEPKSVFDANKITDKDANGRYLYYSDIKQINAIQCIAWTIQTDIPMGNIEKIVRQGDCILIKPKGKYEKLVRPRHLTETEYKSLLVAES